MQYIKGLTAALGVVAVFFSFNFSVFAADVKANKKRGQVYFRMVCTDCHKKEAGRAIPPSGETMAQWRKYFDADRHAKSGNANDSVRYYTSLEFRESIQDSNKAAKKFLTLSHEQLYADVRKFVITGAKDSDTPASCN